MKPVREWMRDRRIAGALAAVAVLSVGYRLIGSGGGSAPPVPTAAVAPSPDSPAPEPSPLPGGTSPPSASASMPIPPGWTGPAWSWTRNPFLAPPAGVPPPGRTGRNGSGEAALPAGGEGSPPELQGTVIGGGKAMAIFRNHRPDGGNRLVPVGGTVGEWTLFRVEPYRVSLRRGNETRILELYKQ